MARRGGHHEEELPFVALMDTMTNVVGVLIIVLVMVGIGLARSVNKVLSELPPVTVEEHAKLKKEVEETKPKHDLQKVDEENKKLEQDLRKSTEALQTLDVTTDKQAVKLIDVDDLQKQLEAKRKERDAKKSAVEKMLAEVDQLKARLDTTPVYTPPPAVVVKLPNPRPMPDKAEVQHFLVAGGRIFYLNDEQFQEMVEAELRRAEATIAISKETVKGPDGKPVMVRDKAGRTSPQRKIVYDAKKLTDYFARVHLGNRDVKVEVIPTATSNRIPMKITPLPNAGETIEQAKSLISVFQTLLKKFKADPKAVVWFHVFKDSIPTYLAAREYADQIGVPVGWDIYGQPTFSRTMPPEYTLNITPPPAAPAPAGAVSIAPPKQTLD
ncbi:MAG: hypothetical protein WCF18_23575 [Chthoniobacteraceae bacterium]